MSNNIAESPRLQFLSQSAFDRSADNRAQAQLLLTAYQQGEAWALAEFRQRHPQGNNADYVPSLLDAHMLVSGADLQVNKPSLEKLKNEAKAILKNLKSGDMNALARYRQHHSKALVLAEMDVTV